MVKTALNSHLLRSYSSADDYSENLSSKQIVDFGNAHLGTPNASSDMSLRVFRDLLPETVLSRKEQDKADPAEGKTLSGISSVFEIICQVKLKKKKKFFLFQCKHCFRLTVQCSGGDTLASALPVW